MSQIGAGRPYELEGEEEFPQVELVRDVLVVPSPGHRASDEEWTANPPVDDAVDLGNGVVIERIEHELAEQVLDASTPRGLNFDAVRQFGQLYSFWREVPHAEYEARPFGWDRSQAITECPARSDFIFAGKRVSDVASGLRRGTISADDIPVRYVVINGRRVAVNNRSLLAFRRAGVSPTRTIDVTSNARLRTRVEMRLAEMGGSPSQTIRVRGPGTPPFASYLDLLR